MQKIVLSKICESVFEEKLLLFVEDIKIDS